MISHASPTMFNAGTTSQQMASCFLLQLPGDQDSIDAIFSGLKNCAAISKTAGGIGLAVHNVRATGSYIAGTNGTSNGLVPMLQVYNSAAQYVDRAGTSARAPSRRTWSPWHADVGPSSGSSSRPGSRRPGRATCSPVRTSSCAGSATTAAGRCSAPVPRARRHPRRRI